MILLFLEFFVSELSLEAIHSSLEPALDLASPLLIVPIDKSFNHLACFLYVSIAFDIGKGSSLRSVQACLERLAASVFYKVVVDH
jgi:hypothetical protein